MDFEKWMVVSVDRSGARADVSNIWKTAPSVLNKIGNMCGQTVSSRYFGYFFNNNHTHKKSVGIAVAFSTFILEGRIKTAFLWRREKGNMIKMVEINFLSNDSLL